MSPRNDEELIRDAQKGDLSAFKGLVKQHEGAVAGVVKSMLGASEEAADVGQEVFIRFYQSLAQFKGESSVRTYLIRIAINLSLNELKKQKRRQSFFTSASEGDHVAAADHKMDLKEWLEYEFNLLERGRIFYRGNGSTFANTIGHRAFTIGACSEKTKKQITISFEKLSHESRKIRRPFAAFVGWQSY